uniref:Uncharacterized protein n=1 Tax=Moniliophthora roreri TaxID=221103 RepID=A0A0W0G9S0_MONRR
MVLHPVFILYLASNDIHDSRIIASLTLSQDQKLTPSNSIPGPDPYCHGQLLVTTMESSSSQMQTTPAARMITPPSNETLIETPLFTPLPSPSPLNKTRKALMLSHIAVPSFLLTQEILYIASSQNIDYTL